MFVFFLFLSSLCLADSRFIHVTLPAVKSRSTLGTSYANPSSLASLTPFPGVTKSSHIYILPFLVNCQLHPDQPSQWCGTNPFKLLGLFKVNFQRWRAALTFFPFSSGLFFPFCFLPYVFSWFYLAAHYHQSLQHYSCMYFYRFQLSSVAPSNISSSLFHEFLSYNDLVLYTFTVTNSHWSLPSSYQFQ